MKGFSKFHADGSWRFPNGVIPSYVPHPKKRAKPFDKRTAQARRLSFLMRNFLADFPEAPGEAALSLARAAAIASVKISRFEAAEARGEEVNDELFVRVAGQLSRAITALRMLAKPEAAERAKAVSDGTAGV